MSSLGNKKTPLENFLILFIGQFLKRLDKYFKKFTDGNINGAIVNRLNERIFLRKARKVCKLFSHNIDNNRMKIDRDRCLLSMVIVALDICRSYQQQLYLIYDDGKELDLQAFVNGCIDRILNYICRRKPLRDDNTELDSFFHSKYQHNDDIDTENVETRCMEEFTKYIISGLWERPSYKIWSCASSRQVRVNLNYGHSEQELTKVNVNNLLDRVYVKLDDTYYFSNYKNGHIRSFLSKFPIRLVDRYQDNITKRCGYRLGSILLPLKSTQDIHLEDVQLSEDTLPPINKALDNIASFDDLQDMAKFFIENCMLYDKIEMFNIFEEYSKK